MASRKGDPVDPWTGPNRRRILPPTEEDDLKFEKDRSRAEQSWDRLRTLPFREQTALVESDAGMQSWALAVRLCDESVQATAGGQGQEALQQTRLALRVASLVRDDPSWCSRLQGYAWAHLANALRAGGDLREAAEGFERAEALWMEGAVCHPGPLDYNRMLRLEALTRRAQGRLNEGISLLERARTLFHTPEETVIQIQRGAFLAEAGRWDDAVQELLRASAQVKGRHAARLRLDLAFNLAASLGHAGRHGDAAALLDETRKLAAAQGTDVDRTRLLWLTARSAAGLGRTREALAALGTVRQALEGHGLLYDAALAALEIAALHSSQGPAAEVKELARGLAPLAQGTAASGASAAIPRGAQATLKLFCRLAEKDGLTPASTRRFADDFLRTGGDPNLRPEPWPVLEE